MGGGVDEIRSPCIFTTKTRRDLNTTGNKYSK